MAIELPYTFRGLTMTDGLTDLLVNTIYKDKSGIIWFGTRNSVDRFDGINFRHYKLENNDNKLKRVNAIAETYNSNIWIGNNNGLWLLDNDKDALLQIESNKINFPVYSLLSYNNQTLYIGTERGLFIHKRKSIEGFLIDNNELSSSNKILAMDMDGSGILWLVTSKGLYSFNTITHKFLSHINDEYLNGLRNIVCVGERIFIGTYDNGLIEYKKKSETYAKFLRLDCNIISTLSSNKKDMLYVGTDGAGVYFISTKTNSIVQHLHHEVNDKYNIRSNSVYSLLVDRDGIVWIGFYQAGVDYSLYQTGLFDTYSCGSFSSQNFVIRSFAFSDKYKALGTRDGLFLINESTKEVLSYGISQISSNLILSVFYFNNQFYIGTYGGGLWVLDPVTKKIKQLDNTMKGLSLGGSVFNICKESNDKIWFATSYGIYCYNSSSKIIKEYTSRNSHLPEGQVYSIFFDSYKRGWIGTENGVALFEPSSRTIKTNIFPKGFINDETIRCIYEDSNHDLYFIPDKSDIFISSINMKSFSSIPLNPAYRSTSFMSISEDKKKNLWIGCDNGLIKINKKTDQYSIFGFSDGIQSSIFSYGASFIDDKGYIWFGTAKGLIKSNIEKSEKINRNPYRISITDIYSNGKSLTAEMRKINGESGKYIFSSSERNLEFHFSCKNYTNPYSMGYEYKLDGIDDDWKMLFGSNVASYFDLPAGEYIFHVRIVGDTKNERSIAIKINRSFPIWITWSIISLIISLLLVRVYKRHKEKSQNSEISDFNADNNNSSDALKEDESILDKVKIDTDKYKSIKLSFSECEELLKELNQKIEIGHLYENPDLKIGDLAKILDVSSPSLSYLFNLHLHKSYYDYINDYRVNRFKQLAIEEGSSKYTLDAMAEKCGFSSRASFFRSFKKKTGITPNEYLNSIRK